MAIWFQPMKLELLNQRGKNTMVEYLGIEFIDVGDNFLTAQMPVTSQVKQPLGFVHGGANVALAETVASLGANAVVDQTKYYCVGLEINANHLRGVREGMIIATASAMHLGRTTQVWHVELKDNFGNKTCISRMTAAVITRDLKNI